MSCFLMCKDPADIYPRLMFKGGIRMNDTQKRREQLLRETRSLYQSNSIPAVHPRYRSAYHNLYDSGEEEKEPGSLSVRILISLILFALFATAEYNHDNIWKFSTEQVVTEIAKEPDLTGYLDRIH